MAKVQLSETVKRTVSSVEKLLDRAAGEANERLQYAADEAGEKPEDSSLLDHYEVLRPFIREMLSR